MAAAAAVAGAMVAAVEEMDSVSCSHIFHRIRAEVEETEPSDSASNYVICLQVSRGLRCVESYAGKRSYDLGD